MTKIAGVTVLYIPSESVITNILSYLNQVEKLFVIDNSETENKSLLENIIAYSNVSFIPNKNNIGVAAALNKAAQLAINSGYDFLLTMDQDSRISDDSVKKMLKEFYSDEKIGIIAPFVIHIENPRQPSSQGVEEITVAMTSGSIIRLSTYKQTGGYLENFFIDYVDNEFCLRIHLLGYKVLQINSVHLHHKLGSIEQRKFFWIKVFPTNHSPLRLYYRTRNRLVVYKKYKDQFSDYIRADKVSFLKELLKILLYEGEKLKKFKMILKGYFDYKKNKFGKLNELN